MSKRLYQHDDTGRMCYTDEKVSSRYFDITSTALEVMAKAILFSHTDTADVGFYGIEPPCECAACTLAREVLCVNVQAEAIVLVD